MKSFVADNSRESLSLRRQPSYSFEILRVGFDQVSGYDCNLGALYPYRIFRSEYEIPNKVFYPTNQQAECEAEWTNYQDPNDATRFPNKNWTID